VGSGTASPRTSAREAGSGAAYLRRSERYEIDGDPDEVDVEGARKWVLKGAEKFTALAEERG
jgi:hypothetical protein